ncbi:sensor histidine kinase [Actinocorallia sp. API 0066]|uniref:HAMP domain-containing sensor histidine kinase n=1 Tax=Actinocorallia sp. API 0066 TaxID=2896846 RepID=UPI001E638B93|nr:sensor histidine kinase [Actinocorallia sp. API 0066]MCD0448747.1 sensor histidine kinase [Actinocorallia sp. API 0066]
MTTRTGGRRDKGPGQSLFWRLFLTNGLVFIAGTLILAVSPATVSAPVLWREVPVLLVGLALILTLNGFLLRRSLAPLDNLEHVMARVDLLRGGDRLPEQGNGDLAHLIDTFNRMLDRLETERTGSAGRALAAQEAERMRIARELHDEIGQSLTVVLLGLKHVVDRAPEELVPELHTVKENVRSSLEEVRQIAHRLRPGVLEDLGLRSALKSLISDFSRTSGLPVSRLVDPDLPEDLGRDVELVLYRVAQESLTNVMRHAGASRVEMSLTRRGGDLVLSIADDGKGGEHVEGAGIRGMRERAGLIRARLTVQPRPGGGTRVTLTVPGQAVEALSERK